jgi:hypothetical protein
VSVEKSSQKKLTVCTNHARMGMPFQTPRF